MYLKILIKNNGKKSKFYEVKTLSSNTIKKKKLVEISTPLITVNLIPYVNTFTNSDDDEYLKTYSEDNLIE